MCYICNCFAWTLDLLQRALTFVLSCWLAISVCCGVLIAVIAGIAYGYNYCLAEFITLTRADVSVYMRRGQFYDRPDLRQPKRRIGEDDDVFPYNLSDYHQQVPLGEDSLSAKWVKDQDTRRYSEKLSKYSEEKTFLDSEKQADLPQRTIFYKLTTPLFRRVSIIPNRIIPTTLLRSGSSEIIMRQFEPLPDIVTDANNDYDSYDYKVKRPQSKLASEATPEEEMEKRVEILPPDIRIRLEDSPKGKSIKMRHWGRTTKAVMMDYSTEVDEDAVVYRAI